ncbi:hypothetical protein D0Z00_004017 [Geotrichum galactomycetum]|uniref:Uncharacterized protein n=1 Tax=Geotrichum galactomycetum TaxID=27317 RepID=A0ACB6UZI5_9ASCO|nr:hypothetical protein D0Z00_004017 [Geotrichum candidum]
MHQYIPTRAGPSPINGSRQQNEVQRHLNRVKLEKKSTSEDDLKSVSSNSRLRHSSSIGSNTSLDERKAPSPSSEIPVSKSTGSLRKTPSIDDSADHKDENGDNNSSTNLRAMSPVSDSSELLPPETNLANGLATPGMSKPSRVNPAASTTRIKRIGRDLGPPKRTPVREESDELLTDDGSNVEISEEIDIKPPPSPQRSQSAPPEKATQTQSSEQQEADAPITPLPTTIDGPVYKVKSPVFPGRIPPSEQSPVLKHEEPKIDTLDATESEAARKRRSELYETAERAHAVREPEEKEDKVKSQVELEREQTLELQHQELRYYLQIQEQLIQQQQQQLYEQQQKAQQQSLQNKSSEDQLQAQLQQQKQQILIMQQQQQQTKSSTSTSRKQKNTIVVNNQGYQRLELIGRGGSSKVYKAQSNNGKIYAIKRVSCDEDIDYTVLKGFKGEIDLLQRLKDEDRVVKLIDFEMRASSIYVVMECGEIDLAHVLNARLSQPLDISFVRYYAVEMLHCVAAVHRHDIVHSDLKPANFLLVKGMLKIIDFGIANVVPDYTSNVHRDTQIGTPNYMAPEALLDANHVYASPPAPSTKDVNEARKSFGNSRNSFGANRNSIGNNRNSIVSLNNSNIHAPIPPPTKPAPTKFKVGRPSDVWSCGCIIYQMIYGRPPYGGYQGTQRMLAIMNPKVQIAYPKTGLGHVRVPKEAIEAIKGCLERDPTQRMTIDTVMNGSFLNPQAVDKRFIQDLLAHAVKYGAERGSAVSGKELDLLTDNVWKKIQASNQ